MSDSDPNRLDRTEAIVEAKAKQVEKQISALVKSQQLLIELQRSLSNNMQRMTLIEQQIAEQQASTNALIERLDRIINNLSRRDREREQ